MRRPEVLRPGSGRRNRRGKECDEKSSFEWCYADLLKRDHAFFVMMLDGDVAFHRARSTIRLERFFLLRHWRGAIVIRDENAIYFDNGAQAVKCDQHRVPLT